VVVTPPVVEVTVASPEVALVVYVEPAESVVVTGTTIGPITPVVAGPRKALISPSRAAIWLEYPAGTADANHGGILLASKAS
jgi:hypothetical protein